MCLAPGGDGYDANLKASLDKSERSERAKAGWAKRREPKQDRHAVGEHPYDAALAALYEQKQKIGEAIDALETLKGGTP